ncbi:hypothetical protein N288_04665 [Bacillus infantis NRRL B-14911]|uniref:Uncharacterized protein n=1 Tax=Bacillus infantis NRRL B-14911 TaxID=1367477 RepID=U5L654_9BACI|nr:hypothetical protein N288_04665 [Bacillus infantis NRRL B-14911]
MALFEPWDLSPWLDLKYNYTKNTTEEILND